MLINFQIIVQRPGVDRVGNSKAINIWFKDEDPCEF
jgi:hypothetical protein